MKNLLSTILLLVTMTAQSQHAISGNFSPAKDFTWLVAYHLRPGSQNYIADTAIEDGAFTLKIPDNKPIGIYRLVYAVPQDEFYFDVIYNGKEDIGLNFDSTEGVNFTASTENIPYSTYFKEINAAQTEFTEFYTSGNTSADKFKKISARLAQVQEMAEKESQGLMANEFIVANRPYIPTTFETFEQYVTNRKEHYFDELDVHNSTLQASGLLTDKLINYVFTALPLNQVDSEVTEKYMQENVNTIAEKLDGVDDNYRFSVFNSLWSQAVNSKLNGLADFTYSKYLKDLAIKTDNAQTILDIEIDMRLRIGAIAPEIEWEENNVQHKLSTWADSEKYLLIFWSSTCSHCLKEVPALHKKLSKMKNIKTLAIGLEDDDTHWKIEAAKLPNFNHTIALGKWDNQYADLYNIEATPTYFILDSEKRIIAKPDSDRDVVGFLEKN